MEPTPGTTVLVFHYLDGSPDRDFHLPGLLRGEPLHQRLDVLLAEHRTRALDPHIDVYRCHANGGLELEEVRLLASNA